MRSTTALLSLTLLVGCLGSSRGSPPARSAFAPRCETAAFREEAPFDAVYQKACHNCYERGLSPSLGAALDRVHNIEIDFWDQDGLFAGGRPHAWYVRHAAFGGNENNCSGRGDLEACLGDVRAWSDAHPGHDVVTVYLDKKQGWGNGRRPIDLDTLLAGVFSNGAIVTPGELKGTHATLRAAAEAQAWPHMDALKGRLLFVLTGGGLVSANGSLHDYVAERGANATAFVAPGVDDEREVAGAPDHFDQGTAAWTVFYNLDKNAAHLGGVVREHHYVARVWGTGEAAPIDRASLSRCVNVVAHDRLDGTPSDVHGLLVQDARPSEQAVIERGGRRE